MKKLFLGIICLFLTVSSAYCQQSGQSLQLIIKTDKVAYHVFEKIKLTATLTNNADKELIIFWSKDKAVQITDKFSVQHAIFPEPSVKGYEQLYIKPKSSISKEVLVDNTLKPRDLKYRLKLEYNYPNIILNFKTTANQKIWTDTIVSNAVTFKVAEKNLPSPFGK